MTFVYRSPDAFAKNCTVPLGVRSNVTLAPLIVVGAFQVAQMFCVASRVPTGYWMVVCAYRGRPAQDSMAVRTAVAEGAPTPES